jgi:acid phosphatase (class A)
MDMYDVVGRVITPLLSATAALTFCGCLAAGPALAQTPPDSCSPPKISVRALLLPPPGQGSAETVAELRELQHLQNTRTLGQAKHALGDHDQSVPRFLGEIGIKLQRLPPFADDFFRRVAEVTKDEIEDAKKSFRRKRPYKLPHNHLRPLKKVGEHDSYSYPSGHAAYGMVIGLILARMLPEKREAILARIKDYGYSRLVSGVHFRSDVYAGEVVGGAIAEALFHDKVCRESFERAKAALREAAGF